MKKHSMNDSGSESSFVDIDLVSSPEQDRPLKVFKRFSLWVLFM